MWTRLHLSVFVALAALVWGFVLFLHGTPVTGAHLTPFGIVVGFLVTLGAVFEHILWRYPWLHGWFVKRPNLKGTWHVRLQSDWIDPASQKRIDPIEGFMGVTQSYSTLQMHLMTTESESW